MADSDKEILITPNVSQTSQPEIKLVGKDNSPMYLRVLDDNSLSFEGTEGQVFSIGPTMSSGDIFSVNDISGIQSMAINADGTVTIDAQTKSTTIKNNASATSTLILENTNADAVDGPILEFYRNTPSPADGDDTGAIVWSMQTDAGNKHEYGRIVMEYSDASDGDERGELLFKLTEDGANEQEFMRLRGGSRQIELNTSQDDIDLCYNSDSTADFLYINAATERMGINVGTSPSALLHVGGDILTTGNITSTSANNYNLYWPLYFQRDNMGTSNIDMRLPVGGSGTTNPNNFAMPRAGKVMAFTVHYYGGTISTSSSNTDTWTVRRHSGGSLDTATVDTVVAMDTLTANANANNRVKTVELGSPLAFNANDGIAFKRTANANSNSLHEVSAVLWIQFDA